MLPVDPLAAARNIIEAELTGTGQVSNVYHKLRRFYLILRSIARHLLIGTNAAFTYPIEKHFNKGVKRVVPSRANLDLF